MPENPKSFAAAGPAMKAVAEKVAANKENEKNTTQAEITRQLKQIDYLQEAINRRRDQALKLGHKEAQVTVPGYAASKDQLGKLKSELERLNNGADLTEAAKKKIEKSRQSISRHMHDFLQTSRGKVLLREPGTVAQPEQVSRDSATEDFKNYTHAERSVQTKLRNQAINLRDKLKSIEAAELNIQLQSEIRIHTDALHAVLTKLEDNALLYKNYSDIRARLDIAEALITRLAGDQKPTKLPKYVTTPGEMVGDPSIPVEKRNNTLTLTNDQRVDLGDVECSPAVDELDTGYPEPVFRSRRRNGFIAKENIVVVEPPVDETDYERVVAEKATLAKIAQKERLSQPDYEADMTNEEMDAYEAGMVPRTTKWEKKGKFGTNTVWKKSEPLSGDEGSPPEAQDVSAEPEMKQEQKTETMERKTGWWNKDFRDRQTVRKEPEVNAVPEEVVNETEESPMPVSGEEKVGSDIPEFINKLDIEGNYDFSQMSEAEKRVHDAHNTVFGNDQKGKKEGGVNITIGNGFSGSIGNIGDNNTGGNIEKGEVYPPKNENELKGETSESGEEVAEPNEEGLEAEEETEKIESPEARAERLASMETQAREMMEKIEAEKTVLLDILNNEGLPLTLVQRKRGEDTVFDTARGVTNRIADISADTENFDDKLEQAGDTWKMYHSEFLDRATEFIKKGQAAAAANEVSFRDEDFAAALGFGYEGKEVLEPVFNVTSEIKESLHKWDAENPETDYQIAVVAFNKAKTEFKDFEQNDYLASATRLKQINDELNYSLLKLPTKYRRELKKEKAEILALEDEYMEKEAVYMTALKTVLDERKFRQGKHDTAEGLTDEEKATRPKLKEEDKGSEYYRDLMMARAFAVEGDDEHRTSVFENSHGGEVQRDRRSALDKRLEYRKSTLSSESKYKFEIFDETWGKSNFTKKAWDKAPRWARFAAGAGVAGVLTASLIARGPVAIVVAALTGGATRLLLDNFDSKIASKFSARVESQELNFSLHRMEALQDQASDFISLQKQVEAEFSQIDAIKRSNERRGWAYTGAKTGLAGLAGFGAGSQFNNGMTFCELWDAMKFTNCGPAVALPAGVDALPSTGGEDTLISTRPEARPGVGTETVDVPESVGGEPTGRPEARPEVAAETASTSKLVSSEAVIRPEARPELTVREPDFTREGIYTVEGEDTIWDIAEGQTAVGEVPAFADVSPENLQALTDLVRDSIKGDPELAREIGVRTVNNPNLWLYTGDPFDPEAFNRVAAEIAIYKGWLPEGYSIVDTSIASPSEVPAEIIVPDPEAAAGEMPAYTTDGEEPVIRPEARPGVESEIGPVSYAPETAMRPPERAWSNPAELIPELARAIDSRESLLEGIRTVNNFLPTEAISTFYEAVGLNNITETRVPTAFMGGNMHTTFNAVPGTSMEGLGLLDPRLKDDYGLTQVVLTDGGRLVSGTTEAGVQINFARFDGSGIRLETMLEALNPPHVESIGAEFIERSQGVPIREASGLYENLVKRETLVESFNRIAGVGMIEAGLTTLYEVPNQEIKAALVENRLSEFLIEKGVTESLVIANRFADIVAGMYEGVGSQSGSSFSNFQYFLETFVTPEMSAFEINRYITSPNISALSAARGRVGI